MNIYRDNCSVTLCSSFSSKMREISHCGHRLTSEKNPIRANFTPRIDPRSLRTSSVRHHPTYNDDNAKNKSLPITIFYTQQRRCLKKITLYLTTAKMSCASNLFISVDLSSNVEKTAQPTCLALPTFMFHDG